MTPFVVRVGVAPQGASILELAARAGRLEQDGGGELGPVEVPVELLPVVVGHGVDATQRVRHRVQPRLPHRCRQEVDERLPLVDPGDDAPRDLVATDRVVDGGETPQGGMVRIEAFNLVDKVDVVLPGVGKGGGVEHGCNLGHRGLEHLGSDERVEAEHPDVAKLLATAHDQRLALQPNEFIEWPTVEVEDLSHDSSRGFATPTTDLYSQLSSSG